MPLRLQIIDQSSVENQKVRHIFGEFLQAELMKQAKGMIELIPVDTVLKDRQELVECDYVIGFDIMHYGVKDVEKGEIKIMVATKIINPLKHTIIDYGIETFSRQGLESTCQGVAERVSRRVIKELFSRVSER